MCHAKETPLWQRVRESGRVRRKYAHYTPEDVEEIDDVETLNFLYDSYKVPATQPQNCSEFIYFRLMADCLWRRLRDIEVVEKGVGSL